MIVIWKFLAGLGIFLLSMQLMENALHKLAGEKMARFIGNNTNSPLKGVITGTLTTLLLQSSSLVTLVLMAFVGAGIISVQNSLGVIYGSNLGTTATGWIVTLLGFKIDLQSFAYPFTAIGAIFYTAFFRNPKWSSVAQFILSFGLLFIGLEFMKSGMSHFAEQIDVKTLGNLGTLNYFLFGLVLTALIQSSSATMLIVLTALNSNVIQLLDAGALVVGADLGTTITALLGSIGGSRPRKLTALAHFMFNVVTDSIALLLLVPLMSFASSVFGAHQPLLTLVLFHSSFNFIGILIFLPFTKPVAQLLQRWNATAAAPSKTISS